MYNMTNIYECMKFSIKEGKKSKSEIGKLSPKVGAVLLQDGKIIGHAFRGERGKGDHAEFTLFEKKLKGKDISKGTLFTTLEPCTYRKNHEPCSNRIIEKGIKKVYIGMLDPNPKIYNKGCTKLKHSGVEVEYYPDELRKEIKTDNWNFIDQYKANPELKGIATFDYSNNNGIYTIGHDKFIFETKWTKASNTSIHAYNDPKSIKNIALAPDHSEISELKDVTIFDFSSRVRTIHKGQILILRNQNDFYAGIKILDIKDNTRGDDRDELNFEYVILADDSCNFQDYLQN